MSQLYIKCEVCDYKGSIWIKDKTRTSHRQTCPFCQGAKYKPIGLTTETVEKMAEEHSMLLAMVCRQPDQCEHGQDEGEWCEPCNTAMKAARNEPENQVGPDPQLDPIVTPS